MADFITDTQLNGYKDAINKKIAAKYDGMRGAFAAFDADGDGKISRKEIARALAGFRLNISRNHLEQVFELADSNGDGGIDYDEFVQMLRKFDMNDAMSRFMSTVKTMQRFVRGYMAITAGRLTGGGVSTWTSSTASARSRSEKA